MEKISNDNFKSDYLSGKIKASRVENFPVVWSWITKQLTDNDNPATYNIILSDNRNAFTEIFDKHNFVISNEFYRNSWLIKYHDITFIVFSAKNRGTDIEVVYDNNDNLDQTIIINFMQELIEKLNNYYNTIES